MKKLFLTALVLFAMSPSFSVSAQTPLPFPYEEMLWNLIVFQYIAPEIGPEFNHPRTPVHPPQVEQSDYMLHFLDGTDLTLNIISTDENGGETIEYTTLVSAETEILQLPATLSGTYTIEVVRGSQHFRSEITI